MKTNSDFKVAIVTLFTMFRLTAPSYSFSKISIFNDTKEVYAPRFSHFIATCKI